MPRFLPLPVVVASLIAVSLGVARPQPPGGVPAPPTPKPPSSEAVLLDKLGVGTRPAALMALLANHGRTELDAAALERLVRQLGDDAYEVREQATRAIVALSRPALKRLAELTDHADPEVRSRAARCAAEIENGLNPDAAL